ncbi:hypothetical protein LSH36_504g02013 [Paralvinella palmiformis]|uniref:Thyrotropin-releasing hormone receptor n=1 Tax=Paralvinella palmiformis TaxID=53620 RepID=A0AAD9J893_9ANNE|nr:hypothetical protein LSH36_504g02013 [Paralvinella palmiformis]
METFIHTVDSNVTGTGPIQTLTSYNISSCANATYDANTTSDVCESATRSTTTGNGSLFGNETELEEAPYFALPYQVVGCLFVSIIFAVGLVGNAMVVIVVLRTRSMHTPTNCYLVSLAIADVLLLISAPLPTIVEYFLIIDQFVLGPVGCALMVFTQYLGINVSSLSITAFTVERYIAICHPMKAQTMCTVRRAKRIIVALWVFGLCYCAPWLGLTTTYVKAYRGGVHIEVCTFKLERDSYLTYYMADLVIFYVVPLLLTCILYGLIARILASSTLAATPGKPTVANGSEPGTAKTKKRPSSSRIQVRYGRRGQMVGSLHLGFVQNTKRSRNLRPWYE